MTRRSSFLDNPHLKVSRPVSACTRCRTAKVKCDGKLPACSACVKAGREDACSSASDLTTKGKERSYVAALEAKLDKLTRQLDHARKTQASIKNGEVDPQPPETNRKDSMADLTAAVRQKAFRMRENSDVDHLVSAFGAVTINALAPDFKQSEESMSFASFVLAASVEGTIPDATNGTAPPARPVAGTIFKFYEDNILGLYPLFEAADLKKLLDDIYDVDDNCAKSSEWWTFWMIMAVGSAAQSQSIRDNHYINGLEFVSRALLFAEGALKPGSTSPIQSLVLLTLYSLLDPAHFDSWQLIGFTCRVAIDLGFHKDEKSGWYPSTKQQQELQRRVFYCVYALDRAISMVHVRPFSFLDEECSVALPTPIPPDIGNFHGRTDVSVPLAQLRQLQSRWYQTLIQGPKEPLPEPTAYVWQQCNAMRRWAERLPAGLSSAVLEMLQTELQYSYVYCLAPGPRVPPQHITNYERMLIFENAISFIHNMHKVAHLKYNPSFYTLLDCLKLWFMGSQLVAVLRDAGDVLLSGRPIPVPLSIMGLGEPTGPPPIPPRVQIAGAEDDLDRSMQSLERVSSTLKRYSERWDLAQDLAGNFETMSAGVIEDLKRRQSSRNSAPRQPPRRPLPTSQPRHISTPSHLQRAPLHSLRQPFSSPAPVPYGHYVAYGQHSTMQQSPSPGPIQNLHHSPYMQSPIQQPLPSPSLAQSPHRTPLPQSPMHHPQHQQHQQSHPQHPQHMQSQAPQFQQSQYSQQFFPQGQNPNWTDQNV
ncbi:fungal-specific transcription factor domain-containing protein [Podospora australis]|uniref:Fungal-specific transcription factor domain-containing protein n=1 Tax=Podospora australis TaxID=1536484 RepID=A0AAN6WQ58_9PEZI|nr:fungal-specific transcription factor domain-containing protein [Podospora australis]